MFEFHIQRKTKFKHPSNSSNIGSFDHIQYPMSTELFFTFQKSSISQPVESFLPLWQSPQFFLKKSNWKNRGGNKNQQQESASPLSRNVYSSICMYLVWLQHFYLMENFISRLTAWAWIRNGLSAISCCRVVDTWTLKHQSVFRPMNNNNTMWMLHKNIIHVNKIVWELFFCSVVWCALVSLLTGHLLLTFFYDSFGPFKTSSL